MIVLIMLILVSIIPYKSPIIIHPGVFTQTTEATCASGHFSTPPDRSGPGAFVKSRPKRGVEC